VDAADFMDNPLLLVAAPDHRLAKSKRLALDSLVDETFVVREPGSGTRLAMERFFSDYDFKPQSTVEMTGNEVIKQAIEVGLGLSVLSAHTPPTQWNWNCPQAAWFALMLWARRLFAVGTLRTAAENVSPRQRNPSSSLCWMKESDNLQAEPRVLICRSGIRLGPNRSVVPTYRWSVICSWYWTLSRRAATTVFRINTATVTGPTPPGTGVIHPATVRHGS